MSGPQISLKVARVGVFGALFAVLSLIPLTPFIGGTSLLTLNIIMTSTISIILKPTEAFFSALFGSVLGLYIAPHSAVFGPFTVLLPVVGAIMGSVAYHRPQLAPIVGIYLSCTIAYFLINVLFFYWIIPHVIAAIAAFFAWSFEEKQQVRIPLHAFVTTMVEQGTMMTLAIYFLLKVYGLEWWTVFPPALPLMLAERSIGAIGGTLLSMALVQTIRLTK
jgi:hypothetical protein